MTICRRLRRTVDKGGGSAPPRLMQSIEPEFEQRVAAVVMRYAAQRSHSIPASQLETFAAQLRVVVEQRGLPRPLSAGECGAPGSMSDEECAPLIAAVMCGLDDPILAEAAKQLVKACFYPEFTVCRDSFRERTASGACRRQELPRALSRVSGAHCVDCPHWVNLDPLRHEAYLQSEWCGDPQTFAAHREVFLPEDFRALRRWLHAAARRGPPNFPG